jgi:hypothetical protein
MDGGAGQLASLIALSLGASWASGINCYGAMLALGLMGMQGAIHLPPDLVVLAHPWVIGAAGLMYLVEFFVDKVPGLDTAWDTLHTLIRIPAGALLAAGAFGQADPALMVTAGILGGTLSASTHAIKAGTRILGRGQAAMVICRFLRLFSSCRRLVAAQALERHRFPLAPAGGASWLQGAYTQPLISINTPPSHPR